MENNLGIKNIIAKPKEQIQEGVFGYLLEKVYSKNYLSTTDCASETTPAEIDEINDSSRPSR